ncbi:MAG: hypothetical protein ACREPM_06210, partial [Gemmatimonadaceae bacterium]
WIAADPALERRFQKVVVRELGDAETLEILQARKERLERHHNVLISDEAIRAAVSLTDRYVTDRMRPDKAIDALDEACAHLQAEVKYTPRTEQLIEQRLSLLNKTARTEQDERRRDGKAPEQEAFGPLERFGAEIEAFFVGTPAPVGGGGEATKAPAPSAVEPVRLLTLAPIEAELGRALMEEGVVIRAHDVARVVGLMAGVKVDWEAESPR